MASRVAPESTGFVPAEIVGNAFAQMYYITLQKSPRLVHRFYKEDSKLGRIERGGALSFTTMTAIDEKIQALGSLKTDIKFVHALESYNGGVIVLVMGSKIQEDDSRRAFTQIFFLAPQEKGYFVLNDIFGYLEDDVKQENAIMEARVQQKSADFVLTAEIVGNAFASQYYKILQESPPFVCRFYKDISMLGRIECSGALSSTTTLAAIDEKIRALGSLKTDIKFVGAQDSYNGGVIVLVTGFMIREDDSKCAFTQTFFLAPQEKGYFVLNDILRYLEDDVHEKQENETQPVLENHNSEQSKRVSEVVDEAPSESQVVVESNVNVQDTPKKSYDSIDEGWVVVTVEAMKPVEEKSIESITREETSKLVVELAQTEPVKTEEST